MRNKLKNNIQLVFTAFILILTLNACNSGKSGNANSPNILFIAVDDLVPHLGCYGNKWMKERNGTPQIDRLAERSMVFLNHHVALPICGSSRASLTTGLMPDEHGVTKFSAIRHPDYLPDVVTLPQHFKNNGYETAAKGKFHDNRTVGDTTKPLVTVRKDERFPNSPDVDDPASWSIPFAGRFDGEEGIGMTGRPAVFVGPDSATYMDENCAKVGMELLDKLEAGDKPFFLAVGFVRPHLPFVAPKRYWDIHDVNKNGLYDDDMPLPEFRRSPVNAPGSFKGVFELLGYEPFKTTGMPTDPEVRKLRHGYFACVSMIDELTGQLLDYLATKDDPVQKGKKMNETTIIVLWGDHGFALGEHNRWAKHIDDELSSWAPLIIYDPRNPGNGAKTMKPVSTLDIFPTLCELADLPIPTQPMDNKIKTGRPLRGSSLVPMLNDPSASVNDGALIHKWIGGTTYIYRTEQYRLIEKFNGEKVKERQLYDLGTNRVEKINIAGDSAYAEVINELSAAMRKTPAAQGVENLLNSSPAKRP
jgi:arylsulfatase A-like enzyme